MTYTLGYQAIALARVREIVLALDAVLLDCRYKPVSRIPGFGHRHTSITGPCFPGALHIYRDHLFFSSELSRVNAGEIGFDALMSVSWDDWLDVLRKHP